MKKSIIFGAALMLASALSFQSCGKEDNPTSKGEAAYAVIDNGAELSDVIANFAKDGVLTIPAGKELVMTKAIETTSPLTITSDAENPATIVASVGFTTSAKLVISNVIIDATNSSKNLVQLPSTAPEATNNIEEITFENVKVKGLKKPLFYSAAKDNLIKNFNIKNSIIEAVADFVVIDFTKGSSANNINVENSTIYATNTTTKSMYSSQGGQKLTELDASGIQTFKFANSTIYNFAKKKNFFSHRQSNQKWLAYDVQGCILTDCGKEGQTIRGMNGGQGGKNPTWKIKGNVFNWDGADTSAKEDNGDTDEPIAESIAVVVKFADAAKGDFTQSDAKAGDPRWIK